MSRLRLNPARVVSHACRLPANYKNFKQSWWRDKDAKECFSVKLEPLLPRDEMEVTEAFGFPSLHLLLGLVTNYVTVWKQVPRGYIRYDGLTD